MFILSFRKCSFSWKCLSKTKGGLLHVVCSNGENSYDIHFERAGTHELMLVPTAQ